VWGIIHLAPECPRVRIGGESSLRIATNLCLLQHGERLSLTDKAVGRMLASMGYRSTQRTNAGWWLLMDSSTVARCHQLYKTYENSYVRAGDVARFSATCTLCQALATPKKS
jgi:hypothetical protein